MHSSSLFISSFLSTYVRPGFGGLVGGKVSPTATCLGYLKGQRLKDGWMDGWMSDGRHRAETGWGSKRIAVLVSVFGIEGFVEVGG